MKLRKIHVPDDRMLSKDDLKFVIGGGDETFDGGTLPEVTCYGQKGYRHTGNALTCSECSSNFYYYAAEAAIDLIGTAIAAKNGSTYNTFTGSFGTSTNASAAYNTWQYCSDHEGDHIEGSENW